MAACGVFCAWCGRHEFRVDLNTVEEAHILVFKCPSCEKVTTLGKRPGQELIIIPGTPSKQLASKGDGG